MKQLDDDFTTNETLLITRESQSRILAVDDDQRQCFLLQRQLEQMGHLCHFVQSGMQACAFLQHDHVDLILTDYNMPKMNGLKFLEHILERGLSQAPVILLSGNLDLEIKSLAIQRGAFAVLAKPCHFQALTAIVTEALRPRKDSERC